MSLCPRCSSLTLPSPDGRACLACGYILYALAPMTIDEAKLEAARGQAVGYKAGRERLQ